MKNPNAPEDAGRGRTESAGKRATNGQLTLHASTAGALMTADPVAISPHASIKEAATLLTEAGFGVLPVIDDDGRVVGVLSRYDIVRHERDRDDNSELDLSAAVNARLDSTLREALGAGYHIELDQSPRVADVMTPMVLWVRPDTLSREVIETMLERHVHHLFVVDHDQHLLGVVSTVDVMRHLLA